MKKPLCGHTKFEGSEPCICSQFEMYWREQIAKEIEADHKPMTRQTYDGSFQACECGHMSYPCQLGARAAAIARGEK